MKLKSVVVILLLFVNASISVAQQGVRAEVWADNWFAFYLNGKLVREDSVSITTERSFNLERFSFEFARPALFAFVMKDYTADDTGLEYIGTRRQQVGDGGLIAQFTDAKSGATVAVSDSTWRCLVIHDAPKDSGCARETNPKPGVGKCLFDRSEEPAGWKNQDFDDSKWTPASVYSEEEVRPKDGYFSVRWSPAARFIWGPNLKTNNTVLCRLTVR